MRRFSGFGVRRIAFEFGKVRFVSCGIRLGSLRSRLFFLFVMWG